MAPCTPVAADVTVIAPGAAAVVVTAGEPVLAGHYPDFPIFPGVCLVECALRGAVADPPPEAGPLVLCRVDSVRFLGAVFPGDTVGIALTWRADGSYWRCTAALRTDRGDAASVRLRFAPGPEAQT
jgi:3-hydroxyacyl-[acyl-carrier-protein] dehydratase